VKLIKMKLGQFRRFAEEQSLDLNEDLIALVGPNEAGKSSVLAAIEMLGKRERPGEAFATRGAGGKAFVTGIYLLEPEDSALLADIHQGDQVTHVRLDLGRTKRPQLAPLPRPSRDLEPREACRDKLAALEGCPALDAAYSIDPEAPWDPELWASVGDHLASVSETLQEEDLLSLAALAVRLRGIDFRPEPDPDSEPDGTDEEVGTDVTYADELADAARALDSLVAIERRPVPAQQVADALMGRLPEVAYFKEEDRQLDSDYQLADVAASPPPALANLCALAGLDLGSVQADLEAGRAGHVEKVFENANQNLKERFRSTWTQSSVYPRLGTPLDGVLRVLIATDGDESYSVPDERSDGLRWFLALHSFLAARGAREPILLVDEAETHLHYDAQADLIDALMHQRVASKVIYTTHSVGCLPPDLGCGIRVVIAQPGAERSRIVNSYWSVEPADEEKVGYAPLLFAMGAQMLALTVPRCALIAEGPADAVLLPSLFREASGGRPLAFRVVPGLSEIAGDRVDTLHRHGGRIACLTDDDPGGAAIREKLREGGVQDELVFHLGTALAGGSLEDLISAGLFADAVNTELNTWGLGPYRVDASTVPSTGRWEWLELQGKSTGTPIENLSKVRVAQRVVDARKGPNQEADLPMLRDGVAAPLGQLNEDIAASLGVRAG
jgi:energy-coupling factor transporter ATP-binding protein EcfA2